MRLNNKIAVITGGASGIGGAGTRKFAEEGAVVIILDINDQAGKALEAEFPSVLYIHTDISSEEAVKEAFAKIEEKYGRVDVLYNNASVFMGGRDAGVAELDPAVFDRVLKINLYGTFYCSKFAIPLLKKRGGGSIINTGSSACVTGVPGCDAYTATKGGTLAMTRSMAVEYGTFNIRTNIICPAAIMTPMLAESNLDDPKFSDQFFRDRIAPLHRWGTPEEIAKTALFLASDDGAYINGAVIVADGGITINGNVNPAGL